ncbi:MAG: sugar nucleotide-binding protein, partial [Spirochaetaceae bacterium]|nr:sugar nucleotide-binding protein [Spirochaetaceae bacterium]
STDYVFDGSGSAPYREDDPIAPQGTYGRTKAQGETRLLAAAPDGVIIRTAWLYGKHGPNFVYTMLRLMGVKDRIGVVADQIGSPTWARDLAETIATIIGAGASASAGADVPPAGIYHFTNAGETSWHQFALEIHRLGRELGILERDCQIDALRTDQYPTKTKRPAYSVLSKEKIAATFGIQVPDWKDSLRGFFTDAFAFSDDQRNLSGLAAYDLTTAKAMLEARRYLYVLYTCQQAVEKNLKTLLCVRGKSAHHHNLGRLAAECEFPASADESQFMDKLTAFYIKGRYQMDVRDLGEDSQRTLSENTYERSVSLCEKIRKHPIFSIW